MKCKECGGKIKPNMNKFKVVLGGSAAIMLAGLLLGTPTGWLALFAAGTPQAAQIARAKLKLLQESNKAGSYFECEQCARDVGIVEAVGSL